MTNNNITNIHSFWTLTIVPGVIHGFYIVHKYNDSFEDLERGGLRYQQVPSDEPSHLGYGANQSSSWT
jgi:hypothetical protein